jgi:FlaG/FlaF family flagellin (archaellin)
MITKRTNESAVSPVVGVMLMLVVTIIIAAVVSAFAGGLSTGTTKAPQMTITATFSQSSGMTITHNGGDTVSTKNAHFVVTPTADFGSYEQVHWTINPNVISVGTPSGYQPWSVSANQLFTTGQSAATTFQAGEIANISAADLSQVQPLTYDTSGLESGYPGQPILISDSQGRGTDAYDVAVGFLYNSTLYSNYKATWTSEFPPTASYPLGERFQLSLVDNSGKTIATTEVPIQA